MFPGITEVGTNHSHSQNPDLQGTARALGRDSGRCLSRNPANTAFPFAGRDSMFSKTDGHGPNIWQSGNETRNLQTSSMGNMRIDESELGTLWCQSFEKCIAIDWSMFNLPGLRIFSITHLVKGKDVSITLPPTNMEPIKGSILEEHGLPRRLLG